MLPGWKRNFQAMLGAAWLELLLRHIPDGYDPLVRHLGVLQSGKGCARVAGIDRKRPSAKRRKVIRSGGSSVDWLPTRVDQALRLLIPVLSLFRNDQRVIG